MSVVSVAASAPRCAAVPFIISTINDLIDLKHNFHKITLEIFAICSWPEYGVDSKEATFKKEISWNFTEHHNLCPIHGPRICQIFKDSTKTLQKMGSFVELTYKVHIESALAISPSHLELSTIDITRRIKGRVREVSWDESLFGCERDFQPALEKEPTSPISDQ